MAFLHDCPGPRRMAWVELHSLESTILFILPHPVEYGTIYKLEPFVLFLLLIFFLLLSNSASDSPRTGFTSLHWTALRKGPT